MKVQRVPDGFVCAVRCADRNVALRARHVVAAHGSWQPGPLPTQVAKTRGATDLLAFKAHFRRAGLRPSCMPLVAFPGGYGGLVHAGDGLVTFSFCLRRDTLERCRIRFPGVGAGEAAFLHARHHCGALGDALAEARRDGDWLAAGPIRPGMRPFLHDGVHVAGNAAAEAHPAIAEGIGMAMQGAALLADRLLAGRESSYAGAWRACFSSRMRFSRVIAGVAMQPAASTLAARVLETIPSVLPACARFSGKTAASGT
jgi:flavin-dependent dehydrogenase